MADLVFDLDKPTLLGGSELPNGTQVNLTGAGAVGSAILLHRATSELDEFDEVTIECCNQNAGGTRVLAIQWGGVATSDIVAVQVPVQSNVIAVDRRRIKGGLPISVWCGATPGDLNVYIEIARYKGFPRAVSQ